MAPATTIRRARPGARRPSAFTLLDLTLALAISGVALAIAAPRYAASAARYRLEAAAARVSAEVAFAQSRAKATGSQQAVVFDIASNQVKLPGCVDTDRPGAPYAVSLGESPYQVAIVDANFSGGNTLTFDGFGVPLAGGRLALRAGASERTVLVNGETGKASVQ
jgi:type II secretory pathway pseudopilin PulG